MLIAMLNHPRFAEFDLSTLRNIYTGATPVPVPLMEQIKEKIGADCSIVFGMTETTGAVTQSFGADSFELKAATVGLPQPHTSIKIINPATGETAPLGESGELCSKAFSNMKGYYNLPEKMSAGIDRFIDKSTNDRQSLMKTVRTLLGAPNHCPQLESH